MNKKEKALRVFICLIVLGGSYGFTWPKIKNIKTKADSKVLGAWKLKDASKGPEKVSFLKDGAFEMDRNGDGVKDVWGEYSVSEKRIILINKGGAIDSTCHSAGVYEYTASRHELHFHLLSDQCAGRVKAFESAWKR